MNAVGLDIRTLAMSLDYARSGIETARLQQQQPGPPSPEQAADVVLELSAAAQALLKT
jgi:hypothetical protein